ncbi:MAG TPA: hypothetical protein VGM87_06430 [Roseomonas sp.]|jgi:hypothetical protein
MPAPVTFLEFARIAMMAYEPAITRAGSFARFSPMDRRASGFQGAVYRRANGGGLDWVVGIAGTQATDTAGADVVADVGFGGPGASLAAGAVAGAIGTLLPLGALAGPALGSYASGGSLMLEAQCRAAGELVGNANQVMGRGDRLYVTGHSLGGGIAQIMAARYGVPAICFNPPTVTAVPGVVSEYQRTKASVVCLQVKNDLINRTSAFGNWLGKVLTLPSPRGADTAHFIGPTVEELSPRGAFAILGGKDPFQA